MTLFENGWESYGMDWENPDPYNPIYLQALQYAAWERLHILRMSASREYPCPNKRTPLNYDAYMSLYGNIKRVVNRGIFVYKPGEEPDGKQTYYSETERYDYGYYVPVYVFCPISFEHIGNEFSSFSKFLQLPSANADISTWQEWLKAAKEVISCCKYCRVAGATYLHLYTDVIDIYKEERPSSGGSAGYPIVPYYSEGSVWKHEASLSYNTEVFLDLCNAWGTASTSGTVVQQDIVDTALSGCEGGRRRWLGNNHALSAGHLSYITLQAWFAYNGTWFYEVEEGCMYGDIYARDYFRMQSLGSSTTYVLTGLPVVYFSDNAVPKEFEKYPEYYLQYNALGYPFKQNEWVPLPTIPMAGSPGTDTEFKVVEQAGFKPTLNSLDYSTLEPPPEPTAESDRTYRHYGFCTLGVYTDFSESLKFK